MCWHGWGNSGGSWLPEDKKANIWHRRGNSGGSWPPASPTPANSAESFLPDLIGCRNTTAPDTKYIWCYFVL